MSAHATKILDKAKKLSNAERADLAACLIASLDERTLETLNPEWEAEIERRLHAIDNGSAALIPWEEARKRIFRDG
jgi:putative addiction module component (TIGR02574 family)